ncbi:hypothetical protein T439DRAFT_330146 [Meredithblackwellia eburnea MCA 4105]
MSSYVEEELPIVFDFTDSPLPDDIRDALEAINPGEGVEWGEPLITQFNTVLEVILEEEKRLVSTARGNVELVKEEESQVWYSDEALSKIRLALNLPRVAKDLVSHEILEEFRGLVTGDDYVPITGSSIKEKESTVSAKEIASSATESEHKAPEKGLQVELVAISISGRIAWAPSLIVLLRVRTPELAPRTITLNAQLVDPEGRVIGGNNYGRSSGLFEDFDPKYSFKPEIIDHLREPDSRQPSQDNVGSKVAADTPDANIDGSREINPHTSSGTTHEGLSLRKGNLVSWTMTGSFKPASSHEFLLRIWGGVKKNVSLQVDMGFCSRKKMSDANNIAKSIRYTLSKELKSEVANTKYEDILLWRLREEAISEQ